MTSLQFLGGTVFGRRLINWRTYRRTLTIRKWLTNGKIHPRRVFVTHGEALAAESLSNYLADFTGGNRMVPIPNEIVDL